MSAQSHRQRTDYKGTLWINSITNIKIMGRSFRIIKETGRHANIIGFASDLVENNILISSGLTRCANKRNSFRFILSFHEANYLVTNEGLLISTNKLREAGIWVADVLKRHIGDQILVAPV